MKTIRFVSILLTGATVLSFATPASADSMCDLIGKIEAANNFTVTFDKVGGKFNDSGSTDPLALGTLKAGETYQVQYFGGQYITRGFNKGTNTVISFSYSNASPNEGLISLWGRLFAFDTRGNVYDPQYGIVGTLHF
ncbi:MAG: hypothetical protein V7K32_21900 [Nostoc sp.]|uniref:hypothetical protein n=1 Tax=Nostoc sp. TaxID=1180 RepID=UPI002FFA6709